jgi:hypothetical protein
MNYKAKAQKVTTGYMPVVNFWDSKIEDNFYLSNIKPTRQKALTAARNYIKQIVQNG